MLQAYLSFNKLLNFKDKILPNKFFVKDMSKILVLFCTEFADPSQSINLHVNCN